MSGEVQEFQRVRLVLVCESMRVIVTRAFFYRVGGELRVFAERNGWEDAAQYHNWHPDWPFVVVYGDPSLREVLGTWPSKGRLAIINGITLGAGWLRPEVPSELAFPLDAQRVQILAPGRIRIVPPAEDGAKAEALGEQELGLSGREGQTIVLSPTTELSIELCTWLGHELISAS